MDTKYLKNILKYMLSAVLCLVLIVYIIYHLTGGMRTEIETMPATYVSIESTYTTGVTLLRSEEIIYSPVNGDVSYIYDDGDKIAINSAVAEIFPYTGSYEIRHRIVEIDRAIRLLENSNMSDAEKRTDTASTDAKIRNYLYDFLNATDAGNASYAEVIADDFLVQLNRRRIITKNVINFNKQIEALKAEKAALSASLPQSESIVITPFAGYFYSTIDGYENILSSKDISKLSYGDYLKLASMKNEEVTESENGHPIGKIVTDYLWYVACEVDISELHNYDTGKSYQITFPYNNDTALSMKLYRILSEAGSETAVLLFESGVLPDNFNYLRHQTVQIIKESYDGCRVPVSSVRVVNGKPGVYVLQGSKVVFKYIDPVYEQDGYIISALNSDKNYITKNDFVVVKGKDLYDGKIVE